MLQVKFDHTNVKGGDMVANINERVNIREVIRAVGVSSIRTKN